MTDGQTVPVSGGGDETLRELLSPKALATLEAVRAVERAAAHQLQQLAAVREEGASPNGNVWAAANGEGFVVCLAIDDAVLGGRYTVEDVEDLISDAMIDASGRGQAVGERLSAAFLAGLGTLAGPPSS